MQGVTQPTMKKIQPSRYSKTAGQNEKSTNFETKEIKKEHFKV